MTQSGRALHALSIAIICASSSQAKGRVERANGTLQDRLVKEMRLCGIDSILVDRAFSASAPRRLSDFVTRSHGLHFKIWRTTSPSSSLSKPALS